MCIVSVDIALIRWIQKCLRGPKVSPVNEKTGFYNEKTDFECIFWEVYFEDICQALELYLKDIVFVLMSSLFLLCAVICATWIERRSSEKFRVMMWRNSWNEAENWMSAMNNFINDCLVRTVSEHFKIVN